MTSWLQTAMRMEKTARYGGAEQERAIWYHGTRGKNLPSILSQGLIPDPKQREWHSDPNSGFTSPSRASLGGIYLTRNLLTARSSASRSVDRDSGESQVIVIVEVQPRSMVADEDDLSYVVRNAVNVDSEWLTVEAFMCRELGTNAQFVSECKGKYVKECLQTIKRRLLPNMSTQIEERVRIILEEGWNSALDRQSAYALKGSSKQNQYDWNNRFRNAASDEQRKAVDKAIKENENAGDSYDEAYYKAMDSLVPARPDAAAAEANFSAFVDRLTKTLKNIVRPSADTNRFNQTARSLNPIGFSGSNKIVGIVEYFYDRKKFGDHHDRLRLVYGTMPEDFVKQWTVKIGEIVMLGDEPKERPVDSAGKAASTKSKTKAG